MAVKYKREDDATMTRDRLSKAYAPRFLPADPKQRLVVIYLGLLAATLMLLAAFGLGVFTPSSGGTVYEEMVTAGEKRTVQSDGGALLYVIDAKAWITDEKGTTSAFTAQASIDKAAWERIETGDRLRARYRWDPETETVTILELGEIQE